MLYFTQLSGLVLITLLKGVLLAQSNNCSVIELDPPEVVVRYGDPVSVSCRSLSNFTHLSWSVPLGNVSDPYNQTVTWETDNLTDWEIQPVCYMRQDDVQCNKTFPIVVYKFPDQVSISIVGHTGPMIEGKKYDLQCDINNFAPVNVLAVYWYNKDELIKIRGFAELPTKTPSNKTVTLKITASRDENDAQYRCEAKLKLGQYGPQPPPLFTSNLLDVEVRSKPIIKCSAAWSPIINTSLNAYPYNFMGFPLPTITWYREKTPVNSSMRLGRNDSGQYRYAASNVVGTATCDINITVEYVPTFNCPASYDGREHDAFTCSVMASPEANITWEKDGTTVTPLHLQTLKRGDSGTYVITAENKHGTKQHNLTINILYAPEIELDDQLKVVKEGENVSLSCTAVGNPEPEVRWSFQNENKATGRRQITLTISEAKSADEGVYTCTATNALGSNTKKVSVEVEGDCPIKLQPVELVVEYGAPATANCSTRTIHNGMGWEASQGALDLMEDVQIITWEVKQLTHWDINPICFINANRQCRINLPVTVYKRPDWVSISVVNHRGPMIEGTQYELQCDVQNVAPVRLLTVNWYKGQLLKKSENFTDQTKFPRNEASTLQISTRSDDDGVQYRCEAKLDLGPQGPQPTPAVKSDPFRITVHYKPVITCLNWFPMIYNTLNSYPYNIMGNPHPDITWYRDKTPVNSSMPLSKNDSGLYRFDASNVMGTVSCDTNITVEYAPTFDCHQSYDRREHDSFTCSVMASPEAIITWEKDGTTVNPLHLQNLKRGDSGTYVITATNKHGTKQHNLTINIPYVPEIHSFMPSKVVNLGNNVSLNCTAEGNPEPEVTWSFQNQTKATGRRQTTLIISEAKSADAGVYTCTATNVLGNDTRNISLEVETTHFGKIFAIAICVLLILLCIIYAIFKYYQSKRSGNYNIQNDAVRMSLLKQSDGNDIKNNGQNDS